MLATPPRPLTRQRRSIFTPEHDAFRESVRAFARREAAPRVAEWEEAGIVDREFWKAAARQGLVGLDVPEEYGGAAGEGGGGEPAVRPRPLDPVRRLPVGKKKHLHSSHANV